MRKGPLHLEPRHHSHSLFHTNDSLFGVFPCHGISTKSSGQATSLKRCNVSSRHLHISQCHTILVSTRIIDQRLKRHWLGLDSRKKLNEKWPELCPLVDQNPKLWRGRARSWSCRRCPCSHPCTCPRQVLPSFGSTSWVKQGQELCLRSRLNPLRKNNRCGNPYA